MPDGNQTPPVLTAKMKLEATCPSHARTDVVMGHHELVMDEPEARGGTDLSLSPVQTYVSSLFGCTNVITHKCAHKLGVTIHEMTIQGTVIFDRRGVTLTEPTDLPIPEIIMDIDVRTDATDEQWAEVVDYLHKFCAVGVAMKASGTNIVENWNLIRD
ncbi:MAG: OsmC family protein [Rhodospirillales bacterium]|nr:OsmC family protein [Rhodospirillales bacterium]